MQATHKKRRRRVEFLAFMNEVTAAYPGKRLDVILDNLNNHKPRNDRWLARHPHVHFHYTPKRASWLNQVEIWFSILQGQSLQDASSSTPSPSSGPTSMPSSPTTLRPTQNLRYQIVDGNVLWLFLLLTQAGSNGTAQWANLVVYLQNARWQFTGAA